MKFAVSPRWIDRPSTTPAPGQYLLSPVANGRNAVTLCTRKGIHMGIGERTGNSFSDMKGGTPGPGQYRVSSINTGSARSTKLGPNMGIGLRGHQTEVNFNSVVLNRREQSNMGPGLYAPEKWNRPVYSIPAEEQKKCIMTTKKGKFFRVNGAFDSLLKDTSR